MGVRFPRLRSSSVSLAASDRTDAAIAKPETPFVRVDELRPNFRGMPGTPSHGQNRGLAVGAADQAPRACDSAHGLTGKERAISRLAAPGSRVTSEPGPHNGIALGAIHSVRAVCLPASEGVGPRDAMGQAARRWHHRRWQITDGVPRCPS